MQWFKYAMLAHIYSNGECGTEN